jgi:hypothetical protein
MDLIFLLAPPAPMSAWHRWQRVASGYVYYVSLKGVTGAGHAGHVGAVEAMLPRIRQHVSVPVGVGFGIRDAGTARAVSRVADAVVIGSGSSSCSRPAARGSGRDGCQGLPAGHPPRWTHNRHPATDPIPGDPS